MTIAGEPVAVPSLDPMAPENRADPYGMYRWLRENDPIRRAADGSWILTRYADGASILRDPRFSTNPSWLREGAVVGAENHPVRQVGTSLMMFLDPPDHTRLRSLVGKAFTPRRVEAMRAQVQHLVDELLDGVSHQEDMDTAARGGEMDTAARGGDMDIVADLGYPLPVAVICELLGVPSFDREKFRQMSSDASRLLDGGTLDPEAQERGVVAGMHLFQYFTDLVEERRPRPGDDLLSAMIAAEEAGDRLTHQELITTATLLFVAGHETTTNLLGNAMLALLRHPDQLQRLRDDPSLIRSAVEELLRYDSPVQFTARITTSDVEVGGEAIPAGEQVIVLVGAANRDPAQFPEPDRLDLSRAENRHLSFAAGPHFCLGAALARLEAQVAISTLLRRFPHLELVTTEPEYREHFVLRGVKELRVRLSPGQSGVG
ncbi:MAG: cytochrome P450 [Acidimicrobiales bacterium]